MKGLRIKGVAAVLIAGGVLLASGSGIAQTIAQVRAALVRNIDTPALAPFRANVTVGFTFINEQRLVTTVPAGKRLVIQHVSYWAFGSNTGQVIFGSLRNGEFGPNNVLFQINPPHVSAAPDLNIQEASIPVTTYFEAGEQVWLSVSRSSGGGRTFECQITGYFVTP